MRRKRRIIYNHDGGAAYVPPCVLTPLKPQQIVKQLYMVVDELVGTQVDTLFFCIGAKDFLHPTDVGEFPQLPPTEEGWETVSRWVTVENARRLLDAGLDSLGIITERAKENELEFFASLRMNDMHEGQSRLMCTFWREYPEYRINPKSDAWSTWHDASFDFAHSELRC